MKKLIITCCFSIAAFVGFSQGTVNFNNNVPFGTASGTPINNHTDRLVYWTDNSTKLTGTNFVAQLYYASSGGFNQSEGSLVIVDALAPKKFRDPLNAAGFEGTWSGGNKTLANVPIGGNTTLQVRVWDGALFGGYQAAVDGNGITGKSITFNYTVPAAGSAAGAFYMEGLQSFTVGNIPEPSTIALGILGAASLLVVRRRK